MPKPAICGVTLPSVSMRIALAPAGERTWLGEAVEAGGGTLVDPADAEGLVWASTGGADDLADLLRAHEGIRWVQLPWAGIEPFVPVLDAEHTWTCGKGVYAVPVAEHALTLGLAGLRGLASYGRATTWTPPQGRNLVGADVTILGGGGISEELLALLAPFGARVTVVRRQPRPMDGAAQVVGQDALADALPGRRLVVLALALTPETTGIIGSDELAAMDDDAWLVNVARGGHVVTDDLVDALRVGRDRRRRPRRHRPRAPSRRPPALDAAERPAHPPRRQHPGDGPAPALGAHQREHPPLRRRRGAAGPGGPGIGLLTRTDPSPAGTGRCLWSSIGPGVVAPGVRSNPEAGARSVPVRPAGGRGGSERKPRHSACVNALPKAREGSGPRWARSTEGSVGTPTSRRLNGRADRPPRARWSSDLLLVGRCLLRDSTRDPALSRGFPTLGRRATTTPSASPPRPPTRRCGRPTSSARCVTTPTARRGRTGPVWPRRSGGCRR